MELPKIRKDYSASTLRKKTLSLNPFDQFKFWLHDAKDEIEPNAMQLATSKNNTPSLRTVLLKGINEEGFIFFTHKDSRKGKELLENPKAALLFLWKSLERQVIIEGEAFLCSQEESSAYFAARPRKSQLGSAASIQDAPLSSREELESAYKALEEKYQGKEVLPPKDWGGFRIKPARFEFWQGSHARLHDRFEYTLQESNWKITRLSP